MQGGGGRGEAGLSFWEKDISFFFPHEGRPEGIGGRIRSTDGGWHSTDGGWRLTDAGWWTTKRSYSPAGALRRFECTGDRQLFVVLRAAPEGGLLSPDLFAKGSLGCSSALDKPFDSGGSACGSCHADSVPTITPVTARHHCTGAGPSAREGLGFGLHAVGVVLPEWARGGAGPLGLTHTETQRGR